ncbi:MAG: CmpA/NrtA family ABC transporter substrate-binding protein [Sphingomicrobium sp.]
MTPLSIAFLPLTDSAVLVAAKERGFAEAQGLDLTLVRDMSWATVRDRLVYGQVQAAHLLAPLAVAVSLGLSQQPAAIAAPFKLGLNGNAITFGPRLAALLNDDIARRIDDPAAAAVALAKGLARLERPPVIGIVHRFSSHALMLRYWLAHAGIDPDRDAILRVLPPSMMTEALRSGEIDGFSAGEPWNSVAVAAGAGEVAAIGANIWQRGPEKVLGLREDWTEAHPETVDSLLRALDAAASWCDEPANHGELAALLSRPDYVGQPAALIEAALGGQVRVRPAARPVAAPDFFMFHRESANFPWRSQALWIYSQFVRWGFVAPSPEAERAASAVFRSDLYRRALAGSATPMPGASLKVEGALSESLAVGSGAHQLMLGPDQFFDGKVFDPAEIGNYLKNFARE